MALKMGPNAVGGDPRTSIDAANPNEVEYISPKHRKHHDPTVTFEEYHYYALKTREIQDAEAMNETQKIGILQILFPPKSPKIESSAPIPLSGGDGEKASGEAPSKNECGRLVISDDEWINASRAMRNATWAACFYLITTDILGPFGVGFAIGTLGWGPGIALFTVFGAMAGYSGYLLWKMYLGLDSFEYPLSNYGDLAFRLYGTVSRHLVNLLQTIQLICSVGLIIVSNGQTFSQVSKFKLCYAVCCVIWAACGFFLGQVRTFQKFGWLANAAIFLNLMIMFITMGVIPHSAPNFAISVLGSVGGAVNVTSITPDANGVYPPIIHNSGLPDPNNFIGSVSGLMQGVFAYGGAQLFVEFMAEMRRPRDFIKAMWSAQFFIYTVYMVYGCYCYHYQGQYTYSLSYQGVSPYVWQTVGNMLAVFIGLIAAGLYGNIGIKILYNQLLIDLLNFPPLTTRNGKIIWACIVPVYWSIAFIIAASIPDFFGLVGVVAAFCVIQFCYSFPPLLALGYFIKLNALGDGEGFDPNTGIVTRYDSGIKRCIRGFFGRMWYRNVFNVIYLGGALATAGLGAYASIQSMISAFKNPELNSFNCRSPLDLS